LGGYIGITAVGASALLLDGSSVFPGWVALVPVVGTILIIGARDRGPLGVLSRWRLVTWLGDVSYAVYLWHWPLIVLIPYVTRVPLTTVHKLVILLLTFILADASTRFLEQPVRLSPRLRSGRTGRAVLISLLVTSLATAGTAAMGAHAASQQQERDLAEARQQLLNGDVHCLGAAAMDPNVTGCEVPDDLLIPPPSSASIDTYNRTECWATFGVSELHLCGFGTDAPDAMRVLAVGDSHNNLYLTAYESLAAEKGWHVDVAGRAGCTWGARPQQGRTQAVADECNSWKDALSAYLSDNAPYDLILTTADQSGYLAVPESGESAREATVDGHAEAWAEQIARGSLVVAIRDFPAGISGVVQCVEEYQSEASTECSRARADAFPRFDALAEAVDRTPGSALLDLRDLMCTATTCPAVIGHVVVYRVRDHLTASFVRTLAPYLIARLPAAEAAAQKSLR
jgi:SGNH domain (fused to AT3 domains)